MDDSRWHRMDALFDAVLDLPEERRREVLDRECAGDPELHRSIERLLALEAESTAFLARPVHSAGLRAPREDRPGTGEGDPVVELAGVRVGPYRLIRPLGHGGMGAVYLAQREDDFRQEVAIKLVRRSLLGRGARRRLRTEGQALARLEHPNIARLYDGGTTEDGIPYLVMERIDGLPIDRFCQHHRLGPRRRLELVRQVLGAVAHVHRHHRVHCDIKPSNILVTRDGTPKLLDFGIAKLLSPEEGTDPTLTVTGLRPLTPAYASPEQVLGHPITPAADIYSVGVLLYELLCGSLPYEMDGGGGPVSPGTMERAIVEQEPIPPSRQLLRRRRGEPPDRSSGISDETTPRDLASRIRGDLDAIALKALRKEPGHRYGSAEAFAEDVTRHLEAHPVRAREGTLRYRAGRLVRRLLLPPQPRRRRERWAWTAGLATVTTVAFLALALARNAAPCPPPGEGLDGTWNAERRTAVEEAFAASGVPFAADTFERVAARIDAYVARWQTTDTELCEATLVRGERSARQLYLGRLCLDDRQEELRTLVDLFSRPDEALVTEAVAAVNQLGNLDRCAEVPETEAASLETTDPATHERLREVTSIVKAQDLRLRIGRPVDFELLRRAETAARQLDQPVVLAQVLHVLGHAESYEGGEPEAGVAHLEEALRAAITGDDRAWEARIYACLIQVLTRQLGDFERARLWQGFATAALEALPPGHHDVEFAVFEAFGLLAWESGDYAAARSHYRRALEAAERDGAPLDQVSALTQLGMFAEAPLLRAIEIIETTLGPNHVRLAPPLTNVAALHAGRGEYEEALALVRRSFQLRRASFGDDHPDLAFPLILMGQILIVLDRPHDALEPLERSLELLETLGPGAQLVRDAHVATAEALHLCGRVDAALVHVGMAEAALSEDIAPAHPSRLNLLRVAGDVHRQANDLVGAVARHRELLAQLGADPAAGAGPSLDGQGDPRQLWAASRTLVEAGHPDEARPLLEGALAAVGAHDRWLAAAIRATLADTVADDDPQRARQLVAEARNRLDPELPLHRDLLGALDRRWSNG